jgi:hypothetical protein
MSTVIASPAGAAVVGYIRLAHLSPDTPDVDVYLDSVSGAVPQKVFPGVGYGVVSKYLPLPTGTYAVSMRLAGAAPSTPVVLTTNVTVAAGKAYTVAGVGKRAELGLKVFDDDLTLSASGKARVRIVQASVRAPVLSVSVAGGSMIADAITFATTTDYRDTAPGRWTLEVRPAGGTVPTTLPVRLDPGNVYSLIVLDAPTSGLNLELRVDASRDGQVPLGGVATGAGGTAPSGGPYPALVVCALVMVALIGARQLRKRRTKS